MKQNKNTIAKLIFTVLFICTAMIQKGNAQTQPLAEANASSKEQGIPKTLLALLLTTVFAYAKGTTRETGYQNVLEANPNLQEIGNLSIGRNYQRLPTTTTNPKIYFDSNAPNLSAHSIEIKSKILFTIPIAPSG